MAVRTISLWSGVPDADTLKDMLAKARNPEVPLPARQDAIGYLTGATKVLATLEKRAALAEYLQSQITVIKRKLYY